MRSLHSMDPILHSDTVKHVVKQNSPIVVQTHIHVGNLINAIKRGETSVDLDMSTSERVIALLRSNGYSVQSRKRRAEDGTHESYYRLSCG